MRRSAHTEEPTVVVGATEPALALGLRTVCCEHGVGVVDVVRDEEELLRSCEAHSPDVVIVTLDVLGSEASGTLALVGSRHRVVLYLRSEAVDHRSLLGLGVAGLVSRYTPLERVVQAVRRVYADEVVLDDPFQTMAARAWSTPPRERLSAREVEVLRRASEGETNRAIGRALNLSEATVKAHLRKVNEKLGTGSRHAAIAEAARRGELVASATRWSRP